MEFIRHLRFVHDRIQLDYDSRNKILNEKFDILRKSGFGKCKLCYQRIQFDEYNCIPSGKSSKNM